MNRLKLVAVGASLAIAPLTAFAQGAPPAASTRVASASPAYPVPQPRDRTPSEWLRDPRVTRAQLDSVAAAVERGSPGVQGADGAVASAIRVRLREGDFPAGERLYLTLGGPVPFADTLLVRDGSMVSVPNVGDVSLRGVLQAELQGTMERAVGAYLREVSVRVDPLVRLTVSGSISRPGVYWFPADMQLGDALMLAGGPGSTGDLRKTTIVRRDARLYDTDQVTERMADGWTLARLDLRPGDEIIVGKKRTAFNWGLVTQIGVGVAVSVLGALVYGTTR